MKIIKNINKFGLIVIFFIIISASLVNAVIRLRGETELIGVVKYTPKPIIQKSTIYNGEYQQEFEKWYNENFSLRGDVIKTYSQIIYSVFNKSPNDLVIKGKNDILFEKSYVYEYLGITPPVTDEYLNNLIDDLNRIQEICTESDKEFYILVTPNKVDFYSDAIPNKYVKMSTLNKEDRNYNRFIKLLKNNNIKYFDSYEYLMREKDNLITPLFSKTGVHWNYVTGANVVKEFINYINSTSDLNLKTIDIANIAESDKPLHSEDADIYSTMNVIRGNMDKYYSPGVKVIGDNTNKTPNIFMQGGSFTWQILEYIYGTKVANEIDFMFYRRFINNCKYQEVNEVSVETEESLKSALDQHLKNKQMIILEVNQQYIHDMGAGFPKILREYLDKSGFPEYEYLSELDPSSTPEDLSTYVNGLFTREKDEIGYFHWITDEAVIDLKNDDISRYGLNFKVNIPKKLLSKQDNNSMCIYINNVLAEEISLDEAGIKEFTIDKGKIPNAKEGIYNIHLKVNSRFNLGELTNGQDNRDVAYKIYYLGSKAN